MQSLAQSNASFPWVLTVEAFFHQEVQILDKISFSITPGQWSAIIGRSGIGKTTLLRCLAGLEGPSFAKHTLKVSYIPQRDMLLAWKNVGDNIALACLLQGKALDENRINYYLELVGLRKYRNHYPHQLSQGMRQRIAIARALFEEADLLLMDEPFASLDSLTRMDIQTSLKTLLAGRTVILVTHDVHEACQLAHDIFILKDRPGVLTPIGDKTPDNLLKVLQQ